MPLANSPADWGRQNDRIIILSFCFSPRVCLSLLVYSSPPMSYIVPMGILPAFPIVFCIFAGDEMLISSRVVHAFMVGI